MNVVVVAALMPLLALCRLGRIRKHSGPEEFSRPSVVAQTAWFRELVHQHKLEDWLATRADATLHEQDSSSNQCPCDVLVNVEPGHKYEGPLTHWNNEEEVLWENLGRPQAVTSLHISRIILRRPAIMQRPCQLKMPVWSPAIPASQVKLRGFQVPDTVQLLESDGLCHALGASVEEVQTFVRTPVCFAVPGIVLQLIRKGAWSTLMFWLKWHDRRRGAARHDIFAVPLHLPLLRREMESSGILRHHVQLPALPFAQSDAHKLAKHLQMWAEDILSPLSVGGRWKTFGGPLFLPTSNNQKAASHDSVVKAMCAFTLAQQK